MMKRSGEEGRRRASQSVQVSPVICIILLLRCCTPKMTAAAAAEEEAGQKYIATYGYHFLISFPYRYIILDIIYHVARLFFLFFFFFSFFTCRTELNGSLAVMK